MEGELAEAKSVYAMGIDVEEYGYGCYNILMADTFDTVVEDTGTAAGIVAGTGMVVLVVPKVVVLVPVLV